MSEYSALEMPPSDRAFSRKASIVGIGETDFGADYRAERQRLPDYQPPQLEALVAIAFERALEDSGLSRADIGGVATSFIYGGPSPSEMAKLLGLKPRYAARNGNIMAGPLPRVCADITGGKADTVAMIYASTSRAIGRQYGGATYAPADDAENATPLSYYYHRPWGWSSQAAHWAMGFAHYQWRYGVGEDDLFVVPRQIRRHATAQPNAIMRKELTLEDYQSSRFIVRPLHLFDMCLVNDGAVCLIVRRTDMARDLANVPIAVAGWAHAQVKTNKLRNLIQEQLRPQLQAAGAEALAMAGVDLADIRHFEGYDASSFHLVNQVEGLGFTAQGTGLHFCADGQMTTGGRVATNTSGGNLSQSYMHGWSQVVEVVRQLRGEAANQVPGLDISMSNLAQTNQTHPIVYARAA